MRSRIPVNSASRSHLMSLKSSGARGNREFILHTGNQSRCNHRIRHVDSVDRARCKYTATSLSNRFSVKGHPITTRRSYFRTRLDEIAIVNEHRTYLHHTRRSHVQDDPVVAGVSLFRSANFSCAE